MRSNGRQDLQAAIECRLFELPTRGICLLQVPDRQQDFDIGGQESGARKPTAGRCHDATDGRGRSILVPLYKTQQRKAGLRLDA